MNGQIVRLMLDKGFGFIRDESKNEYFFHRTALPRHVKFDALREGMRVEFTPVRGEKGPRAEDVILQV